MIDQTFGFDTACTEASKAVNSAPLGTSLKTSRALVNEPFRLRLLLMSTTMFRQGMSRQGATTPRCTRPSSVPTVGALLSLVLPVILSLRPIALVW